MKLWTLTPEAQLFRDRKLKEGVMDDGQPLSSGSDYQVDGWCFNRTPWGHRFKWEFMLRMFQHQWGQRFMLEADIGTKHFVNFWAVRIIKELCRSPIVDLMGSGSSSKTFCSTCFCYTAWKMVPFHTSAYLSTTTGEGADARAWAIVNQIYREDKFRIGKMINSTRTLVMEEADEINEENAKFRDLRNSLKCVLIPTGNEGRNVVAAISGRKNKRVLWQCDEMPFMDVGVLSGRVNLLHNKAGGGWAQFIGCGNGPKEGDPMYIDAEPVDGWLSVNKDEHWRWETKSGVCLYFNGDKGPNLRVGRGQKVPFPGLADWEVRDVILKNCWGDENTPEFWQQWFGFPPSVNISDTVLTKAFIRQHGAFDLAEWSGESVKMLAGLDLGFRKDGDPCVIQFGKLGRDTRGKKIVEMQGDGIVLNPDATSKEAFETQIAKKVLDALVAKGCHDLALDVSADGGIMMQHIEMEARTRGWQLTVTPVSFSGTAEEKIVIPGNKKLGTELYDRMVSQIWGQVRHCVGNGVVRGFPEHGKGVDQFCKRKFLTDEKKRFSVESKKLMKKRLKRSPDQADAAALCVFLALRHGLSGVDVAAVVAKPPVPPGAVKEKSRYGGHATARHSYTGR